MFAWDTHSQKEGNIIGSEFMKHNHTLQLCLLLLMTHNTRPFRNPSIKVFVHLPEVLLGASRHNKKCLPSTSRKKKLQENAADCDVVVHNCSVTPGQIQPSQNSQWKWGMDSIKIYQLYIFNLRRSFHLPPFNFHKNRNSNQGCWADNEHHFCCSFMLWMVIKFVSFFFFKKAKLLSY